jgi:ATP-dependent Lon protease
MEEMNINKELPILIIPNTVLLHKTNTTLRTDKKTGQELYNRAAKDDFYGIALAPKVNNEDLESHFYNVGTLIKIIKVQEMRNHYQLRVKL